MLPAEITSAIDQAAERAGPIGALITFQGVVHKTHPLRIIDGVVRDELTDAVAKMDQDALIEAFNAHIDARWPIAGASDTKHVEKSTEKLTSAQSVAETTRSASKRWSDSEKLVNTEAAK